MVAAFLSFGNSTTLGAVAPTFDKSMQVQHFNDKFTVVWTTSSAEGTVLEWATSAAGLASGGGGPGTIVNDTRGAFTGESHSAQISSGTNATIFFDIFSGGVADPNGPYSVSNVGLAALPFSLVSIGGKLFQQDGTTGAADCLIHLQLRLASGNSAWTNTVTASDGSYSISPGVLYNEALTAGFTYTGSNSAADTIALVAICDATTRGSITDTADQLGVFVDPSHFAVNFNANPLPAWSVADQSFSEGVANGLAIVEIVLSQTSGIDESVDFATTQGTANSSGSLQDYGNSEVIGTVTVKAGETSTTTTIPIINDSLDEEDENFTITLSNPTGGEGFAVIADGTGIITITDDDEPPTVSMAAFVASTVEGNTGTSTVNLTVDLSAVSGLPVMVTYSTVATGTNPATADTDFVNVSGGTLLIGAGAGGGTFQIVINGDEDIETDETFEVLLDSATTTNGNVTTTAPTQTEVTITNDDADPDLSVDDLTFPEPADGTTSTANVVVNITPAWIGKDVVVTYTTADGSATSTADYIDDQAGGTVTISGGQTFTLIPITIVGDAFIELGHDFTVTITSASNATIVDGTATVTIVEKPTLSIADATAYETSSTATLTIEINPTTTTDTTVRFSTADGTATAGADYTTRTNVLTTIPANDTSTVITVTIRPDNLDEHDETFTVALFNASAGTIVNPTQATGTVTIIDDDALPVLSIADPADVPEEVATGIVTFTITLAPVSGRDVTVGFATQDGPTPAATAGLDYGATSSSATIAAGQTSFYLRRHHY